MIRKTTTCVLLMLLACAGCQTKPLGGTRWRVAHWVALDPPEYKVVVVEFRPNGQLVLTRTDPDGNVTVENRDHFSIKDDIISFDGAMLPTKGMFNYYGQNLRVHTDEFILYLEPAGLAE